MNEMLFLVLLVRHVGPDLETCRQRTKEALAALEQKELIARQADGSLRVTSLGEALIANTMETFNYGLDLLSGLALLPGVEPEQHGGG